MKHSLNILTFGLLLLVGVSNRVQAQYFSTASVSESTTDVGNITSTENTGNDVKTDGTLGTMHVNVWGGNDSGLGWDNGTTTGHLALAMGDPDVALVKSNGTWYAVISYNDGSGYPTCTMYPWSGGTFNNTPSTTTLDTHPCGNTNIDGNSLGDFVIIYDDFTDGDLKMIGGTSSTGAAPAYCASGLQSIPSTTNCIHPDVALYVTDGEGSFIHFTYTDASMNTLYVGGDKFSDLCSGFVTNVAEYNNYFADGSYVFPRIACPPDVQAAGDLHDWAVAVSRDDDTNNLHDIIGVVSQNNTVYVHIYTDGSETGTYNSLHTINGYKNKYAAISYFNSSACNMVIGWRSMYGSDANYTPTSLVAVHCNNQGAYQTQGLVDKFMIVPTIYSPTTTEQDALSISGRDLNSTTAKMFYTYYDNYSFDVRYKDATYAAGTLRRDIPFENGASVYPNPTSNLLHVEGILPGSLVTVVDLNGKVLIRLFADEHAAGIDLSDLLPGTYLLTTNHGIQKINKF